MLELASLLVLGFMLITLIGLVRFHNSGRWRDELVAYSLRFPRTLDAAAVAGFFNGLAGLAGTHWERMAEPRAVAFELVATHDGIRHQLLVPRRQAPSVLATMRAVLPGVTATPDESWRPTTPTVAAGLGLSEQHRPLAVERTAEIASSVLAAVQPLAAGERIVVQWVLSPLGPVGVERPAKPQPKRAVRGGLSGLVFSLLWNGLQPQRELSSQDLAAMRAKRSSALFAAAGRIGVTAGSAGRARRLLGQVFSAHHMANAPGVHLYRRRLLGDAMVAAVAGVRLPVISYPATLNAAEAAALVAFPVGTVALPGLRLAGCRPLAPSSDIPSGGRVLGRATFPGSERPLALSVTDSLRHLHVIGPTGVGKSTLLASLITQDIAAGRGVVVLDPKGDLVSDVLDRVPASRTGDVIVLDPTDDDRPVGLNLLASDEDGRELVVDQVVGIFHQLYRAFWGPRTDDILRAALLTLVGVPGMTLAEVPLLLTDAGFRRRLVGRVDDPVALGPFWGWYEGISDAERTAAIGPVMNKLRSFLLRRRLRNVLGQADSPLDFDRVLAERRILLVPLAKGLLGEEASALIGSLVVARLWQAVQRRAGLAPDLRHPTFAFIDEFQDYLHLPTDVADVLTQARGLGLGLTLAHQHLGQLPNGLRAAVLANARSRVMFQLAADDARTLAKELTPHLDASDLQGLDAYEVVMTLSAGARVAPPVTATTELPPTPTGQAAIARSLSRQRYGADRDAVEAALRARHGGRPGGGALGRREVSS